MTDKTDDKPGVPRWAVITIVTLAGLLVAVAAGILERADGAGLAAAIRIGATAFAATVGVLLAVVSYLGGRPR